MCVTHIVYVHMKKIAFNPDGVINKNITPTIQKIKIL
jgi:hypothetical protein